MIFVGTFIYQKNLKVVVDNLIGSCIICFRIPLSLRKKWRSLYPRQLMRRLYAQQTKPVNVFQAIVLSLRAWYDRCLSHVGD